MAELLIELHYLPNIAFFSLLNQFQRVQIEACENYQKGTFRNRTRLAGANGQLRLSVPLRAGKNEQQPIQEVRIAYDEPWQRQHWHTIQSAYGKAPYFEFYSPALEPLFQIPYEFLFDWNKTLLQTILKLLPLDIEVRLSTTFQLKQNTAKTVDARNKINPRLSALPFDSPTYAQVFQEKHGFLPNLSILDLLFCTGPESVLLLDQSRLKI